MEPVERIREVYEVQRVDLRRPRCWKCGFWRGGNLDERGRLYYVPLCDCGPPISWAELRRRQANSQPSLP